MKARHLPVMTREVVEYLNPKEGGAYIDATVGPGGHAEEILRRLGESGVLLCIDRDAEAISEAHERLGGKCRFIQERFSKMNEAARGMGVSQVDGVLFDFGLSMLQLREPSRGFGFDADAPLDMRMDRRDGITAGDIVNSWPEKEIERVLREYGEEKRARKVASTIARKRKQSPIGSCRELAGVVVAALGGRRGRVHPATRTFQALRIAVNDELGEIERGLSAALDILAPAGRLVAISYHSLEDRAVKQFMRNQERAGRLRVLTKKPVTPARDEILNNPSARSAKLRAGEAV